MRDPWAATVLAATIVGIAACGESDTDHGAEPVQQVEQIAAASSETNPSGGAIDDVPPGPLAVSMPPRASGSIEESTRMEIRMGDQFWTVSHTKDPYGSFILFRKRDRVDDVVHVFFGEDSVKVVGPRETVTWECGKTDDRLMPLVVKTPSGELVYAKDVECGDGVYVRTESDQS